MAPIIYQWVVEGMDCYPSVAGQADVAKTVRWRCNATDGSVSATTYGSVDLDPYLAGGPFTAFATLTQDTVIGWVQAKLSAQAVSELEAMLAAQITTPAIVTPKLPWA